MSWTANIKISKSDKGDDDLYHVLVQTTGSSEEQAAFGAKCIFDKLTEGGKFTILQERIETATRVDNVSGENIYKGYCRFEFGDWHGDILLRHILPLPTGFKITDDIPTHYEKLENVP